MEEDEDVDAMDGEDDLEATDENDDLEALDDEDEPKASGRKVRNRNSKQFENYMADAPAGWDDDVGESRKTFHSENSWGAPRGKNKRRSKTRNRKSASSLARRRIAAILQHPAAKGRRKLAEHLALNTDVLPSEAIATLENAPRTSDSAPNLAGAGVPAGTTASGDLTPPRTWPADRRGLQARRAGAATDHLTRKPIRGEQGHNEETNQCPCNLIQQALLPAI